MADVWDVLRSPPGGPKKAIIELFFSASLGSHTRPSLSGFATCSSAGGARTNRLFDEPDSVRHWREFRRPKLLGISWSYAEIERNPGEPTHTECSPGPVCACGCQAIA